MTDRPPVLFLPIRQDQCPSSIRYNISNRISVTLNCNNLLDILPKWDLVALNPAGQAIVDDPAKKALLRGFLGFSGRYDILGYNGSQFSQLGRMFNAQVSFRF